MERNSLLKLISIFLFLIPTVQGLVIEDFEDVSDWSIGGVDWYSFTTSTDQVQEGTFSGKALLHGVEDDTASKTVTAFDISSADNISIEVWLNESEFAYNEVMEMEFKSGGTSCGNSGMSWTKTDTNDKDWATLYSGPISAWTTCNTAAITFIAISIFSGDGGFDPTTVYLDILQSEPADSCSPPSSGDWIITNGDFCSINSTKKTAGNLNISNGGLEIAQVGQVNVTGGFVYVSSGSNITVLSGGQLYG